MNTVMRTIDDFFAELSQLGVILWLDEDRLRYRAPEGILTPDLLNELKSRKAEIISFLTLVNTTNAKFSKIVPISRTEELPLSYSQQRLWLQSQFEPHSLIGNIPNIYRLTGRLNVAALDRSQNEVVRRHEILRATFPTVDRQPTQVVAPELWLPLPIVDLQHLPAVDREQEAHRLAEEESRHLFNLATEPLLRLTLIRLADDEHILIVLIHRMICDGASFDIFFRELLTLYQAFAADRSAVLPELPIQYADYAAWQRQWLQSDQLQSQLNYWKQQLGGKLTPLQLPTDYPRPSIQTYRGARHYSLLPKALSEGLNAISQKSGATLFMTLLAAFKVLLYRYSGQEDLFVSFTNGGRGQEETEGLIGSFSNTLVLRTNLAGETSFLNLLDRVRQATLEAFTHQDLPFERVLDEIRSEQGRGRSPLLQVLFALNPPWTGDRSLSLIELPELTIKSLFGYVYIGETKFDLTLVMRDTDQGLRAILEYNADLFASDTITRMLGHFQTLLTGIVANPSRSIATLPVLTPEEIQQNISFDRSHVSSNLEFSDATVDHDETASYAEPKTSRDDIEQRLTLIWENLLGIQTIGIQDNFFDLGGISILAVRMFAQIEETFAKTLPLATLLQAPTIEQLATLLREEEWVAPWSPLVEIQASSSTNPPLFCIHGGGFNVLIYRTLAMSLGKDRSVYGLQARGMESKIGDSLAEIAVDYIQEIQRVQPEGPYLLGGLSNGGHIALEMAQQLQAQGQTVALLAMFDSNGPGGTKLLSPFPRLLSSIWYALKFSVPRLIISLQQSGWDVVLTKLKRQWSDYQSKTKSPAHPQENLLRRRMNYLSSFVLERSPWSFYNPSAQLQGMNDNLSNNLKQMEESYRKVYKAYDPQPYAGKITLFRAMEFPPGYQRDSKLGWGKIAKDGVDVYQIPGHHTAIMESPILAEKMRTCIETALANRRSI